VGVKNKTRLKKSGQNKGGSTEEERDPQHKEGRDGSIGQRKSREVAGGKDGREEKGTRMSLPKGRRLLVWAGEGWRNATIGEKSVASKNVREVRRIGKGPKT